MSLLDKHPNAILSGTLDDPSLVYDLNEMRLRIAVMSVSKIHLQDAIQTTDAAVKAYIERRANDLHKRHSVGPP